MLIYLNVQRDIIFLLLFIATAPSLSVWKLGIGTSLRAALWFVSFNRPEQAPPTVFPHLLVYSQPWLCWGHDNIRSSKRFSGSPQIFNFWIEGTGGKYKTCYKKFQLRHWNLLRNELVLVRLWWEKNLNQIWHDGSRFNLSHVPEKQPFGISSSLQ